MASSALRIVVDGPDAVVAKQRGEDALENLAIGQHVGNAAGDAQIVFENGEAAIGKANQIGAADADVDVAWNIEATHFAAEMLAAVDQFARDDVVGEDAAFVIDVAQEKIERGEALGETLFDLAHSRAGMMRGNRSLGKMRSVPSLLP